MRSFFEAVRRWLSRQMTTPWHTSTVSFSASASAWKTTTVSFTVDGVVTDSDWTFKNTQTHIM